MTTIVNSNVTMSNLIKSAILAAAAEGINHFNERSFNTALNSAAETLFGTELPIWVFTQMIERHLSRQDRKKEIDPLEEKVRKLHLDKLGKHRKGTVRVYDPRVEDYIYKLIRKY